MRTRPENDSQIQMICDYIHSHLQEELTHEHLMTQLGIKSHVLVAKFPQKIGLTVTAYVIKLRLEAVVALVRKGMKLEEAAFQAGFRTYSHFYKVFVKKFGISPRAYFTSER